MFSRRPEEVTESVIKLFEEKSREWVVKFTKVYLLKSVTLYIHAMFNHVGQFMWIRGSILPFTQQGLEKFNDIMTKHYFRSTSHQNEKALVQLMQKQNRLEFFTDKNAKLPKHHEIVCSNCKQSGHNKLTCTKACTLCGVAVFCTHLVDLPNGSRMPQCQQENSP